MAQNIVDNLDKILKGEVIINYVPAFRIQLKKQNLLGEYKCTECNIDNNWNNKELLLELDHIDGNKNNNIRENLRWICPNCHSQTNTFRNKNPHKINNRWISDKELKESIKQGGNISDILRRVGLKPKGDNYNRVHKLCINHNMTLDSYGEEPAGSGAYFENK